VPLAVAQQAFHWLIVLAEFRTSPAPGARADLCRSLALLGVACWWALNRFHPEPLDIPEISIERDSTSRHESEDWEAADDWLAAFERVVLVRLEAVLGIISGHGNMTDYEQQVSRQFLFLTHEIGAAVERLHCS
jgi:hypothetical protein